MSVKAVCLVNEVTPKSSTEFTVNVSFASLPDGTGLSGSMAVDLEPTMTNATMESVIKTAVKTYLQGQGVSFGIFDTVRLIGALL